MGGEEVIVRDEVGDIVRGRIIEIQIGAKVIGNLPKGFKYLGVGYMISSASQKLSQSVDIVLDGGTTGGMKAN